VIFKAIGVEIGVASHGRSKVFFGLEDFLPWSAHFSSEINPSTWSSIVGQTGGDGVRMATCRRGLTGATI
jgi:hypothetical protein